MQGSASGDPAPPWAAMRTRRSSEQWTAIVAAFERSNQSVERYCAKRGIRPATFKWWRWRLRESSAAAAGRVVPSSGAEVRLVPVDVVGLAAHTSNRAHVEIAFADVTVRVEVGTDATYVASLVTELRSRC